MRKHSRTIQAVPTLFDKPAKDRIQEACDKLFRAYGVKVGLGAIAKEAESNVETVLKHYGYYERLVSLFVKSLIQQTERYWDEVEQKHPNDAEGAVRYWAFYQMGRTIDPFDPDRLLSRSAAELSGGYPKHPLLVEIEHYWQAERRRLVKLCRAANFRDLTDKLLLLVHGVRNERGAFGHHAPSRLLPQAADDLMVAHGAIRKPLLSWNSDED